MRFHRFEIQWGIVRVLWLLAGVVRADTFYWSGGTAQNSWTNGANWTNSSGISSSTPLDSASDYIVNSTLNGKTCTVDSGGAPFQGKSLTLTNNGILLVGSTTSLPVLLGGGTGNTNAVVLSGGTLLWTSAANLFTATGGVYVTAGTTSTIQYTYAGSQLVTFTPHLAGSGTLSVVSVAKPASTYFEFSALSNSAFVGTVIAAQGPLMVGGATTFSNATVWVNAGATGILNVANTSFGTLILNGGTMQTWGGGIFDYQDLYASDESIASLHADRWYFIPL